MEAKENFAHFAYCNFRRFRYDFRAFILNSINNYYIKKQAELYKVLCLFNFLNLFEFVLLILQAN